MFLLKKILVALVLPPTGPVLLALFGIWLSRSKRPFARNAGLTLAVVALLGLLVLALPAVSRALVAPLEPYPPLSAARLRAAQAIVVLGGGTYRAAPEYGGDTAGTATMERLRYGARLARASGLPLLVTGGAPFGGRPEGELMREALETDFRLKPRWVEIASRDTAENASLSAPLLQAAGIKRIVLVSHARHLPRAVPLFEQQGFDVAPAPTILQAPPASWINELLPGSLNTSREALNEHFGRFVYYLREKS